MQLIQIMLWVGKGCLFFVRAILRLSRYLRATLVIYMQHSMFEMHKMEGNEIKKQNKKTATSFHWTTVATVCADCVAATL